jgi:acetyltransferase-like isoleucine patch superfamily enzyme
MKVIIFAIVFICPPFLKKIILSTLAGARFGRHSKIGWFSSVYGENFKIGDYSTIKPFTLIRCDGTVSIGKYTEISSFSLIYGSGNFKIGDKGYIGPQSLINVTEDVIIGDHVGIGARTMLFTHGSFLPYTDGYPVRFGSVKVGNKVWMAAGVFIHPGVNIGDHVFINSRSVISQNVSSGQVVEGFPAKEICPMNRFRRPVSPEKKDKLIQNILTHFLSYLKQINNKVRVTEKGNNLVSLDLHGKTSLIGLVTSKGTFPTEIEKDRYDQIIILLNQMNFNGSISFKELTIFDFTTMKTKYSNNKLCRIFYLFLKQYYGIFFEYD